MSCGPAAFGPAFVADLAPARLRVAVCQALEAPATVSEIAAKLIERFEVSPEECKAAVLRRSRKMQDLKPVFPRPA